MISSRSFATNSGWAKVGEQSRRRNQLLDLIGVRVKADLLDGLIGSPALAEWVRRIDARELDPAAAAAGFVAELKDRLGRNVATPPDHEAAAIQQTCTHHRSEHRYAPEV